jgi:predicted GIY-YIG superfamily endonuclease
MHYVYLIRSISFPDQIYIGFTNDLKRRMSAHNAGESKHTAKYKPWQLINYHAFSDKRKAQEFEYYLKTGSGQAFAKRHF